MTIKQPCTACDGEGKREENAPNYGLPFCREAWVLVDCNQCDGSGFVEIELEDAA